MLLMLFRSFSLLKIRTISEIFHIYNKITIVCAKKLFFFTQRWHLTSLEVQPPSWFASSSGFSETRTSMISCGMRSAPLHLVVGFPLTISQPYPSIRPRDIRLGLASLIPHKCLIICSLGVHSKWYLHKAVVRANIWRFPVSIHLHRRGIPNSWCSSWRALLKHRAG